MKSKDFDCLEMKPKGPQKLYQATKDMTIEELEYGRRRTKEARRWLAAGTPTQPKNAPGRR